MPSSLDDLKRTLGELEGGMVEVLVQVRGTRRAMTTASTQPWQGDSPLGPSCSAVQLGCLVSGGLNVFN